MPRYMVKLTVEGRMVKEGGKAPTRIETREFDAPDDNEARAKAENIIREIVSVQLHRLEPVPAGIAVVVRPGSV